ncbi:MAG: ATP-dependent Clp protease ATP-binding subunit [Gemmatimonadetes bacterium]|nr:ATP-dependent Clp protease ATP-binding subunit [Gemmatimonadota bacterium]
MAARLKERVRGQDHVIDDLSQLLMLQWAKERRGRPIANLLLLGPTGTGKTELSKTIAAYLYGDERALLRFDCVEFSAETARSQLVGAPLGYVGSAQGGVLTRPVINNPKRVILFDEISDAPSPMVDLFLPLMGEGRLTEAGSGEVADFTQAVTILTSNKEFQAVCKLQEEIADYHERVNAIKSHLAASGAFRTEVIGRFDRVYVFKPLAGIVIAEIAALKMSTLAREYRLELEWVDPSIILAAMDAGSKLAKFGNHQLVKEIDDMLGPGLVLAKRRGAKRVRLERNGGALEVRDA